MALAQLSVKYRSISKVMNIIDIPYIQMEIKFKIWGVPCNFYKLYATENVCLYPPKNVYEWLLCNSLLSGLIKWVGYLIIIISLIFNLSINSMQIGYRYTNTTKV